MEVKMIPNINRINRSRNKKGAVLRPKILEFVYERDLFYEGMNTIAQENAILLDVGGRSSYFKRLASVQHLFITKNVQYLVLDIIIDRGLHLQADAHNLPIRDNAIDAIIIHSVLEHVHEPIRVMGDLYRVMKNGGNMFGYVPFLYPYHGEPDLWRMTGDGLLYLLKSFKSVKVQPIFGYAGTTIRFLTLFKIGKYYDVFGKFINLIEKLLNRLLPKRYNLFSSTTGYNFLAYK